MLSSGSVGDVVVPSFAFELSGAPSVAELSTGVGPSVVESVAAEAKAAPSSSSLQSAVLATPTSLHPLPETSAAPSSAESRGPSSFSFTLANEASS